MKQLDRAYQINRDVYREIRPRQLSKMFNSIWRGKQIWALCEEIVNHEIFGHVHLRDLFSAMKLSYGICCGSSHFFAALTYKHRTIKSMLHEFKKSRQPLLLQIAHSISSMAREAITTFSKHQKSIESVKNQQDFKRFINDQKKGDQSTYNSITSILKQTDFENFESFSTSDFRSRLQKIASKLAIICLNKQQPYTHWSENQLTRVKTIKKTADNILLSPCNDVELEEVAFTSFSIIEMEKCVKNLRKILTNNNDDIVIEVGIYTQVSGHSMLITKKPTLGLYDPGKDVFDTFSGSRTKQISSLIGAFRKKCIASKASKVELQTLSKKTYEAS